MAFMCRVGRGECISCGNCTQGSVCCPNCGEECETLYLNDFMRVLGCEHCVRVLDSCDLPSEYLTCEGRRDEC